MNPVERIIVIVSVMAVVAACIWYGLASRNVKPPNAPPTGSSPTTAAAPTQGNLAGRVSSVLVVQVGEIGAVDAGNGMTDVAATPKALIGLAQAGAKRNKKAYDRYFSTGLAFRVADGTQAKLLMGGRQINQIEFVDGALAGKTGWIPAEWIRPANSLPRKDRSE